MLVLAINTMHKYKYEHIQIIRYILLFNTNLYITGQKNFLNKKRSALNGGSELSYNQEYLKSQPFRHIPFKSSFLVAV